MTNLEKLANEAGIPPEQLRRYLRHQIALKRLEAEGIKTDAGS